MPWSSRLLFACLLSGAFVLGEPVIYDGGAVAQDDSFDDTLGGGATIAIVVPSQLDTNSTFVTLSTGNLVFVRGQRFVVAPEPAPAAVFDDPPPPPPGAVAGPIDSPVDGATWVPGYWAPAEGELVWVDGCYVDPKPGHAFVPPRWVAVGNRHLYFEGFFVPYGVWVRSFFNTFHFSGDPRAQTTAATRDRGPYWPIGFRGPSVSVSAAPGRGPYWPLGLGPPAVLNRGGASIVGLPNNGRR